MQLLKKAALFGALSALLAGSVSVYAVPVLQVGAPTVGGNCASGPYVQNTGSSTNPTEDDTAITSGNALCVSGEYANGVVLLGGKAALGLDWTGVDVALPASFNGKGAILIASVPDGKLTDAGTLKLNDGIGTISPFLQLTTGIGSIFPNNHDPLKDTISDFLFFDIGNFDKIIGAVDNFQTNPPTGDKDGEVLSFTLSGQGTLEWIHFDVLALQTDEKGQSSIVTTIESNPGSKDVTWKNPDVPPPPPNPDPLPEPGTLVLLGLGLLGLVASRRRIA